MLEGNDFVFLLCLPSSAGPPPAVPHGHKGAAAAANITRSRKRIQRSGEQWGPQSFWRPALEWVPLQIPPLLSLTGGVSTNIHQHGPSPGGMRSAGSASVLTPAQDWGGSSPRWLNATQGMAAWHGWGKAPPTAFVSMVYVILPFGKKKKLCIYIF